MDLPLVGALACCLLAAGVPLIRLKTDSVSILHLLALGGAFLISDVAHDLMPEAFAHSGVVLCCFCLGCGFLIGVVVEACMREVEEASLPSHNSSHAVSERGTTLYGHSHGSIAGHSHSSIAGHSSQHLSKDLSRKALGRKALMVLLVDGLHNFHDGVLLAGAESSVTTFAGLLFGVILHEIPQELSDVALMKQAGWSTVCIAALNCLSASPVLIAPLAAMHAPGWMRMHGWSAAILAGLILHMAVFQMLMVSFRLSYLKVERSANVAKLLISPILIGATLPLILHALIGGGHHHHHDAQAEGPHSHT